MASYQELHDLRNHPDIIIKIHVAIADVAVDILAESPTTTDRQTWAKDSLKSPVAQEIVHYVLIANKAASVATILAATDATFKTNVSSAVDVLIGPAV